MSDSQGLGLGFAVGDASIFGAGQLADAFGIVKAKLQQVASNDGLFAQVFGDKANTAEFQSVRGQWAIGDFSQLTSVQVISAADMNGADGAYASSTQKIYLSDAAFGMGAAITLVEEIGHFLDAKVGNDTVGDEGERFASSVFELLLSADELSRINNEDDRGFVTVDGQSVVAEFASNRTQIVLGNRVDFDGDGKTDFLRQEKGAFANDAARMLETYLSNGNGSFRQAWVSQDANRNMHGDLTNLFMGDFNGDGRTDFLRQEKGGYASDNWWMLETFISNGNGSFTSRSAMHDGAMNGDLTNLFIGDFNGDGKSDFLRQEKGGFASDAGRMLETYLSNGDGTFRQAWVSQDANRNMHGDLTNLFMGDFNGDGRTDFLRQEKGGYASDNWWMLETFISNGNGSFTSRSAMHDGAMNGDLTKLFVGDFDGNGRADFLRQERGAFASDNGRMLETYTSNTDGSFVKRWQSDDGAMHGDLTNLFTNNNRTQSIAFSVPAGNWKAEYFNNVNRSGSPVLVQDLGSGNQNFSRDWGLGSPGVGVNADNFSARVTTQRYFAAGLHQIESTSDDGVRVTINGSNVIDKMVDQSTTNKGIFNAGNGGTFNVVIDYYERGGGAKLSFSSSVLSSSAYRLSQLLSKSTPLTIQEINESRNLIAQNSSQAERENLYSQLQYKTPYFNQRDNSSSGRIADVMCNVTTLANCLTFLGITNPNSNKQFEDALEDILRGNPKKYPSTNGINARYWWSNLSKLATSLGATSSGVQMLKGFPATDVQFFQTFVRNNWEPALKSGKAVMTSVATTSDGHIVRVIGVDWQRGANY